MNEQEQCMPKVNGKSFRCPDCGANVFTKVEETETEIKFRCNGCNGRWIGEKPCAHDS